MKVRILKSQSISIIGRIFIVGLFIFLLVCLRGAVVRAAVPGSAGDDLLHTLRGKAETVEESEETVYLPLIFNNYDPGKKYLHVEELVISALAAKTTDRWTMNLAAGNTITLMAAPGAMVDIVLSIIDEDGASVIDNQNLSPAGEVETIINLNITEAGQYDLVISTGQEEATDYALLLLNQDSYNFVLRGTFFENGSRNDSLAQETDHFWFFSAQSGDSLSFTITPDPDSDPYIELYNPAAERFLIVDDTLAGEPEILEDYTLADSGLYAIRIGEFDFLSMDYQIDLSIEP